MFWGNFLYLGVNMWGDTPPKFVDELTFDYPLWTDLTDKMSADGLDLLVIDLGDGVAYESHPEISVRNAWSPQRLRDEIARLRSLNIEPIPKLNFSAGHDAWLHEYSRQVSTPRYYQVCADLIGEVAEIFDCPRFFHIGMDEETPFNQKALEYMVVRQGELWWHDLAFLCAEVERHGGRPWVWSDYVWTNPEPFYAKMPKSVLQSNWYYGPTFDAVTGDRRRPLDEGGSSNQYVAYLGLDDAGYDQAPTGSNVWNDENFGAMIDFCVQHMAPQRLLGFLQTPWRRTVEEFRDHHLRAIDQVAAAKAHFESSTR